MRGYVNLFARLTRDVLMLPLVLMLPRNRKKVVFGAWRGENFSDNPKYFMKALLERGGVRCIWIGKRHLKEQVLSVAGAEFAEAYSFKAIWHFLTAKWYVCNIFWDDDIMRLPTCGRATVIDFWHGIPYKNIGRRQLKGGDVPAEKRTRHALRRGVGSLLRRFGDWCYERKSWTSVSSDKMAEVMADAWPDVFAADRMLRAGMPRNDFLMRNKDNTALRGEIRHRLAELLGLPEDKRWYVYLPTWRNCEKSAYSFSACGQMARLREILASQNAVLVEKQHPRVLAALDLVGASQGDVHVLAADKSRFVDPQELLLCADRLISDYSSCFFDYELTGRPVIHFAYDLERYESQDTGVVYPLARIAAGPVVADETALLEALGRDDRDLLAAKGPDAAEPVLYEQAQASSATWERLGL